MVTRTKKVKAVEVAEPEAIVEEPVAAEEPTQEPVSIKFGEKALFTPETGEPFVGSCDDEGQVTKYEVLNGVVADFPMGYVDSFLMTPLTKAEVFEKLG